MPFFFPIDPAIVLSLPWLSQNNWRYHLLRLHDIKLVSKVSVIVGIRVRESTQKLGEEEAQAHNTE